MDFQDLTVKLEDSESWGSGCTLASLEIFLTMSKVTGAALL